MKLGVLMVVGLLFVGACGGDADEPDEGAETSSTTREIFVTTTLAATTTTSDRTAETRMCATLESLAARGLSPGAAYQFLIEEDGLDEMEAAELEDYATLLRHASDTECAHLEAYALDILYLIGV